MFPIKNGMKQGDAFNALAFEYAIKWVQVKRDGLKLSGTHQLLVYADDVNTFRTGDRDLRFHISTVQDG
jgi:hypothetical protein